MTPNDWAHMSWLARDRYLRRTRAPVVDVEPPITDMSGMSVPELRAPVPNVVDLARAIYADLPKEPDDITAERREFLHSLDKRQPKGKR